MPFVTAEDGVRLHYRAAGRARRGQPALVFVHGWCSNLEHWAPVMDAFAATHRVVGFDLRGHGRSDAPPRGYTMRRFADDMAAVADAAGVKSAVVVGHSLGGVATVEAGRRHPDLVRALVLVETPLARYVPAARLRTSPAYRMVFDPPG
ncbi:MAG: alpha/beta fold hydrolase [Dehalococcoidia bacterium]